MALDPIQTLAQYNYLPQGFNRVEYVTNMWNMYEKDGVKMPETFKEQGELIWEHLGSILKSAQMNYSNLVSVRTFLARPEYDEENMALRKKYLGDHEPTLTVVCAQLLDPRWKLEVEAMAAG